MYNVDCGVLSLEFLNNNVVASSTIGRVGVYAIWNEAAPPIAPRRVVAPGASWYKTMECVRNPLTVAFTLCGSQWKLDHHNHRRYCDQQRNTHRATGTQPHDHGSLKRMTGWNTALQYSAEEA
eukprot:CAMPEP_0114311598 /NCGR_PEP_ID=MMETSP0059-20121206/19918_1 /TAXON_ID=36894 /ORGANISM="Pyramimonas parkeae, Strain CCMP726" /LENGTH=122 /DNA_ID=CAMNT_0001435799 /DNA_START=199 /DNA_END=564 /DNA_ORIENTATION=-